MTASIMNTHVRDNLNALRAGGIAISSQAANEVIFASSSTQLSRSASLTFDGTTLKNAGVAASSSLIVSDNSNQSTFAHKNGGTTNAQWTVTGGATYLDQTGTLNFRKASDSALLMSLTNAGALTVTADASLLNGKATIIDSNSRHTINLLGGNFGSGAVPGNTIYIGRNADGSGAAGNIDLAGGGGADNYLWVDASGSPGKLRISTAPPEADGTPSDTSGTVVGDQTCWHAFKRVLRSKTTPEQALATILKTRVHDFEYRRSSYLDAKGKPAKFTGFVGRKRSDWFLKNVGPQQIPALDEITVAGYLTLATQAQQREISRLRADVAALKARHLPIR